MTLVLAISLFARPAIADVPAIVLTIYVADLSGKPIPSAVVVVLGSDVGESRRLITDAQGAAYADRLGPGLYRIKVTHAGYVTYRGDVNIEADVSATLGVTLRRSLKTIASVDTSSGVVSHQTLNASGPLAKVSPTIVDAMNQLVGVQVAPGPNGVGLSASLGGQDPSLTSYSIDGSPIGNGAALAINSDLLSSAQFLNDSDAVNLSFLSPSIYPQYNADATVGNYGSSLIKSTAQGMIGELGFAIAHTIRGADSALNGETYLDQSGLDYRHVGALVTTGNMIKLTGVVSDWNISGFSTWSGANSSPLPVYYGGSLPAGFGPNIRSMSSSSNQLFTANGIVGKTALSLSVGGWNFGNTDDARSQIIALQPLPQYLQQALHGSDETIAANFERNERVSYTATASNTTNSAFASNLEGASVAPITNVASTHELDLKLEEHIRTSAAFEYHVAVAASEINHEPFKGLMTASATTSSIHAGGWSFDVNFGDRPVASIEPASITPIPAAAQALFDCDAGTSTINAPGDTQTSVSSRRVGTGYNRTGRYGRISAYAYAEQLRGVLMSDATVSLANEPPGFLPPSYVNALKTAYGTVGGCAGSLVNDSIFVTQNVGGLAVDYRGINLTSTLSLGTHDSLLLGYSYTSAYLANSVPLLISPLSPFVTGSQLPGVAPQKASITYDWHASDGKTELLDNVLVVSRNNSRNLPTYATINVGIVRQLSPALSLVGTASNISSAYAGTFVTGKYAVPLRTVSGALLPTLAAPIGPARIFMGLELGIDRSPKEGENP